MLLNNLMAAKSVEKLAEVACIADAGKPAAGVVAAGILDSFAVAAEVDTAAVVDYGIAGEVLDGSSVALDVYHEIVEILLEMVEHIVDCDFHNLRILSGVNHLVVRVDLALEVHNRKRVFVVEVVDHIEAHRDLGTMDGLVEGLLNSHHVVVHFE